MFEINSFNTFEKKDPEKNIKNDGYISIYFWKAAERIDELINKGFRDETEFKNKNNIEIIEEKTNIKYLIIIALQNKESLKKMKIASELSNYSSHLSYFIIERKKDINGSFFDHIDQNNSDTAMAISKITEITKN